MEVQNKLEEFQKMMEQQKIEYEKKIRDLEEQHLLLQEQAIKKPRRK